MQTKSYVLRMSDGFEICGNRWMPDEGEKIKGVVQLHHGLAEHSLRYDRFGSILADNGYVLNAYDMRGHGRTAEKSVSEGTGMFGKLADKDGFFRVVEDLKENIDSVKKEYPDTPVFLLGHSFGSFVSQGYIEKYSTQINGCILSGTAGPRPALVNFGNFVCNFISKFHSGDEVVPLLEKLSFGSYNKRIKNPVTDHDWLSTDEDSNRLYLEDKWCNIPLTLSFYKDMMAGLKYIHKDSSLQQISQNLPIHIIYGTEDPVGDYGKSPHKLYECYIVVGIAEVDFTPFEGMRHEILNDKNKEIVEADILKVLDNWVSGKFSD